MTPERYPLVGFNPLYRGTWFPTFAWNFPGHFGICRVSIRYIAVLGFQHYSEQKSPLPLLPFQSAISRYLVSNVTKDRYPLVEFVSIRYIAVLGFQRDDFEGVDDSWVDVSIRYIAVLGFQQRAIEIARFANEPVFQSAISRYLVSNNEPVSFIFNGVKFQSAISRYLVSNFLLTCVAMGALVPVSIRYIAVLGFQQGPGPNHKRRLQEFQSAISRYLVSNLKMTTAVLSPFAVSIRYIAVLGFQRGHRSKTLKAKLLVSIRYIAVLGFQRFAKASRAMGTPGFNPLYRGTWFPTSTTTSG